MNNEEIATQLMLMRNAITSLHEHLAPDFKTRDLVLLKHGFTEEQISQFDKYLLDVAMNKSKPSKEDFRAKLAEIKGIPHFTNEATEEILSGYKSDGIHAKIINNALK
ncbi:hypothetical protein P9D53_13295 [Bacillus haynesii]|uniref:hypothetical protein n=1 Tax=Bacillus haynesii TaxID=1925021 RepID=UPI002DBFC756|nr:hypothetical protein [Bacillus haynesii]MEC1359254.1 hypothetical protein [Bacillus haynesii]